VRLTLDEGGIIREVAAAASPEGATRLAGAVVPGMPNLHSHSFQRAMAGLAERAGPGEDSFWTWRELMYGLVAVLAPEDVAAIAAQLFLEMLRAGYTAVAEFHYLHHDRDGTPYAAPTELSDRVIDAARRVGIAITHLPVLYARGGFGDAPPGPRQSRFLNDGERFLRLVAELRARWREAPDVAIGIAPHSLRAVTPELLDEVLRGLGADAPEAPIHIHIAEQQKEVEDCLAWSGARPVAWLLDHAPVDRRWCLVHATHMDADETRRLAGAAAVAGLCPTTEANLGDGIFPAERFLNAGGIIGIGSDSHVAVDPAEELRLLEYGQRLTRQRRNLLADGPGRSTGARLYGAALAGGAAALGQPAGAIAPGCRADLVVLDTEAPSLAGKAGDALLDAWIFAGARAVRTVLVGGRAVIRDGHHAEGEAIAAAFRRTMRRLLPRLSA
jgi:formimidoylglutamate deiminase